MIAVRHSARPTGGRATAKAVAGRMCGTAFGSGGSCRPRVQPVRVWSYPTPRQHISSYQASSSASHQSSSSGGAASSSSSSSSRGSGTATAAAASKPAAAFVTPTDVDPPLASCRLFINLTNGLEAAPQLDAAGLSYSYLRIRSTDCEQQNFAQLLGGLDANLLMCLAMGYSCVVFDCGSRSANGGVPRALWYGLELVRYSLNRLWLDRNSSSNRSSRSGGGVGDATGDLQGGEEVEGRGLEQAMASGNSCGSTAVAAARTSGQQTQSSQSGEATTTQAAADLRRSQSRASAWNTPHLRGVAVTADFEKIFRGLPQGTAKRLRYYSRWLPPGGLPHGVRLYGAYRSTAHDSDDAFYQQAIVAAKAAAAGASAVAAAAAAAAAVDTRGAPILSSSAGTTSHGSESAASASSNLMMTPASAPNPQPTFTALKPLLSAMGFRLWVRGLSQTEWAALSAAAGGCR